MNTKTYRSSKKYVREPLEFYATPPEAVRALLSVESFDCSIWESACGNGHISKELIKVGHKIISTDLAHREYGEGGIDFLKTNIPKAKHIITNPPYGIHGLADAFTRKALIHTQKTGGTVALLLNFRSLCHTDRHHKFIKTHLQPFMLLTSYRVIPMEHQPSISKNFLTTILLGSVETKSYRYNKIWMAFDERFSRRVTLLYIISFIK